MILTSEGGNNLQLLGCTLFYQFNLNDRASKLMLGQESTIKGYMRLIGHNRRDFNFFFLNPKRFALNCESFISPSVFSNILSPLTFHYISKMSVNITQLLIYLRPSVIMWEIVMNIL